MAVFVTPVPTMTVLKDACDEFQSALNSALGGDRVLVAQKNTYRQTLVNHLHTLGHYVLMTAAGNRFIAVESGFTLSKEPAPVVINKPTGLTVENSNQAGQLLISIRKVRGAVAYMHQYSSDPALKEESWMCMTSSATKCKLPGLKAGTIYFIRVGAIGTKDQVLFSDVASKMAA